MTLPKFPTRPRRTSFGTTYLEKLRAVAPFDVPTEVVNLICDILGGAGQVLPLATHMFGVDGGAIVNAIERNAWEGEIPGIDAAELEYLSAGTYKISYPATMVDNTGDSVPILIQGVTVTAAGDFGADLRIASYDIHPNGHEVTITLADNTGTPEDAYHVTVQLH